jgi:hypothetical protein
MAEMTPGFMFTGSLSNLSAYKRRDSNKVILRTKGGASKEKIKHLPSFEKTRKINSEFGGRSTACKWIRLALWPQLALADYNIAGPLNALLKPVQELDKGNEPGRRSVLLSKQPSLLAGFSLNQVYPFGSVVRNPLSYVLDRDRLSAHIDIPALLLGINFHTTVKHPLYSFVAALGVVPDVAFDGVKYVAHPDYDQLGAKLVASAWYPVLNGSPALRLAVSLPTPPPDAAFSLMLSIGIRFGTVADGGVVQQVEHAGSAKVLGMG